MVTVTNTGQEDILEYRAGYGAQSIDLGAPGIQIFTTDIDNRFGNFGGTSASTPLVAATVALLYALPCEAFITNAKTKPSETALFVKNILLDNVDKVPSLDGKSLSGGRINALNAMEGIRDFCGGTSEQLDVRIAGNPVSESRSEIQILYETLDFDPHQIEVFNALGQLMYQERFLPPPFEEKQYWIPNRYAKGVYFLSLVNQRGIRKTTSFIVKD